MSGIIVAIDKNNIKESWIMEKNLLKGIPFNKKLGYSIGNLGFGIVFQVGVSYIFLYATGVLKLSAAIIGLVVGVGVIWDGITDPIMGIISDNTRSKRFGRRHLYLLAGGICAGLFNYLLWIIDPGLSDTVKLIWLFVTIILVKSALTVFSTPHSALGAELSADYHERTTIQVMRTVFFLTALFFALVVFMAVFFKATPDYPQGQLNPEAYPRMGLAASLLMIVSCLIAYFSTRKYIPLLPEAPKKKNAGVGSLTGAYRQFGSAFKNRDFVYVVCGYLFTNVTTALFSVLGLHAYTYTFGFNSITIGIIFAVQIIISILSQPVWSRISHKIDKKPSIIAGLLITIASCVIFIVLVLAKEQVSSLIGVFIAFSALLGFGSGVLLSMPLSMIADTIDVEELKSGRRSEGVFYGLFTLCYKLSQSIVLFIVGFVLVLIGFDANLPVQSNSTATWLGLILGIGCIFALLTSILCYRKYRLNRDEVLKVQTELKARSTDLCAD